MVSPLSSRRLFIDFKIDTKVFLGWTPIVALNMIIDMHMYLKGVRLFKNLVFKFQQFISHLDFRKDGIYFILPGVLLSFELRGPLA